MSRIIEHKGYPLKCVFKRALERVKDNTHYQSAHIIKSRKYTPGQIVFDVDYKGGIWPHKFMYAASSNVRNRLIADRACLFVSSIQWRPHPGSLWSRYGGYIVIKKRGTMFKLVSTTNIKNIVEFSDSINKWCSVRKFNILNSNTSWISQDLLHQIEQTWSIK